MADLRIETYDAATGQTTVSFQHQDDEPDQSAAARLAADAARAAVAGMSPTGGTRKAVEALADAVEALTS